MVSYQMDFSKIEKDYALLNIPIIYIQGMKDRVVSPTTADFVINNFPQVPYLEINMIPNQKHFLSFPQKDRLVDAMVRMLKISGLKRGEE